MSTTQATQHLLGGIKATGSTTERTLGARFAEVFNVKDFSAAGDDATNDTAAIVAAVAALQANGGGTLYFPPGIYRVAPTKGTVASYPNETALLSFSSLRGVHIHGPAATIKDTNTYSTLEAAVLFKFDTCRDVRIALGKVETTALTNTYLTDEGLNVCRFHGACSGIDIALEITGGSDGVRFYSTSAAAESVKSSHARIRIKATNTHKPLVCAFSGSDVDAQLDCDGCGRNYYAYGVKRHRVTIKSKNQRKTSVVAAYEGVGCSSIDVSTWDRESNNCQAAAEHITVDFGDSTAAIIKDVTIRLDVKNNAGNPFSHTFGLRKFSSGSTPDVTGRGHVLDGLTITGVSEQLSGINHWSSIGSWASTDVVRSPSFRDLVLLTAGNFSVDCLNVLTGTALFQNIYCAGDVRPNGNTTAKVLMIGVDAGELCLTTTDTACIDYIGCRIRNATLQSDVNKRFTNTYIGTRLNTADLVHSLALKTFRVANERAGDLTGTNNTFKVKISSDNLMFRLKYALIADRSGSTDCTFGIKTFVARQNSSGVWTSVIAVGDEVTERTVGTASVLTVTLVNGDATGAFIACACTNYSTANARAIYELEVLPLKFSGATWPLVEPV